MVKQLSGHITTILVRENIIKDEDSEIYLYGIKHILINLITFIIVGILAIVFQTLTATIFFFFGFMPIRMIAGGFHANTPMRCNVLSLVIYSINMYLIYLVQAYVSGLEFLVTGIVIIAIIIIVGPVDHKNRVLDRKEYERAKKQSRIVCLMILGLCLILYSLEANKIFIIGALMGSLTASISLIIGKIVRGG